MSPEQQICALVAIIAEQRETIDGLKKELEKSHAQSDRYSRWWLEADAELEKLKTGKTNVKPEGAE